MGGGAAPEGGRHPFPIHNRCGARDASSCICRSKTQHGESDLPQNKQSICKSNKNDLCFSHSLELCAPWLVTQNVGDRCLMTSLEPQSGLERTSHTTLFNFSMLQMKKLRPAEGEGRPLGLPARRWRPEWGTSGSSELRPCLFTSRWQATKALAILTKRRGPFSPHHPGQCCDSHCMDEETGSVGESGHPGGPGLAFPSFSLYRLLEGHLLQPSYVGHHTAGWG